MSILIRGMEMPKNCFECPWRCKVDPENLLCRISGEYFEETFSSTIQNRHKSCPLVLVPPHGRLIEDSKVLDIVSEWCPDDDGSVGKVGDLREMLDEIEALPTIIPASGGEEDE